MNDKVKKFNKYEFLFFRIHLAISGFGVFLFMMMFVVQDAIVSLAQLFLAVVYTLFYVVILNFFISIVRLIKYLFAFKDGAEKPTIKRTVIVMLTSPIALALYFIMTLAMSLSLASCS